jgi:hypothetical protein
MDKSPYHSTHDSHMSEKPDISITPSVNGQHTVRAVKVIGLIVIEKTLVDSPDGSHWRQKQKYFKEVNIDNPSALV